MAYLIKVIIVYSAFGIQLGNPIWMMEEYPNMQLCQAFQEKFMTSFPQQLNLEYSAFADSKCMNEQEFMEYMQQIQGVQQTPTPDDPETQDAPTE